MKLIVGLGNPGKNYADSRHNIGFLVIKNLGKTYKILLTRNTAFCLAGKGKIQNKPVIIALPLTYMNLSGLGISALIKKYKIELKDLLVICDDLDLEFGRMKIRPKGSSGGHKGLASIIGSLESQDFCRLRLGIGRPKKSIAVSEFVLSYFNKKEKKEMGLILEKAGDCCAFWVKAGIAETMNLFNRF